MTTSAQDSSSQRDHPQQPFGGRKRLYNVVQAKLRINFIKHDFDARELQLRPGDQVIVETERGPAIAEVTGHVQRKLLATDSIQRVLRRASDNDINHADRNEQRERDAYRFCLERIRTRNMPMKLIRAQYMHDGSKIVFYFSADGRIDFRDLVKDLAHKFRTRIEMHQIGVRDGARMLGGIGPCGRELCCSTFLEDFSPVSIRMAKAQGLTLNPSKVSGMCGRLMCCLVYEQRMYKRIKRSLPRAGQHARTAQGIGEIIDLDVVNRKVTIRLRDQNRSTLPVAEIEIIDANKLDETVDSAPDDRADKYLWSDANRGTVEFVGMGELAADGGQPQKRRKRGSRRRHGSKNPKD
ncbi:MAG: stage 0 sporulation family protein [Persicimonas sp.]